MAGALPEKFPSPKSKEDAWACMCVHAYVIKYLGRPIENAAGSFPYPSLASSNEVEGPQILFNNFCEILCICVYLSIQPSIYLSFYVCMYVCVCTYYTVLCCII